MMYAPPSWTQTIARIARERQFPDILDGPEVEEAWREGVTLLGRSPGGSPPTPASKQQRVKRH